GFPAATRAVTEWFPAKERATAMGIINGGTAVGAVAAPPLIAAILTLASWRWIFFLTGAIGLAWTIWWHFSYFVPVTPAEEERELQGFTSSSAKGLRWTSLLGIRETWGLVAAKFLSDAAWYFYLFWLPKYLYDVRGFDTRQVGYFAWIPYAASGVGSLTGGWFSSRLLRAGYSLDASRKLALGASAAMM